MVFISAHYTSETDFETIATQLGLPQESILFCGSAAFATSSDTRIPYHPLVYSTQATTTIKEQHCYLDCLLRALQIEVPERLIYYNKSLFDTDTVLSRTKEHCTIVGIKVVSY